MPRVHCMPATHALHASNIRTARQQQTHFTHCTPATHAQHASNTRTARQQHTHCTHSTPATHALHASNACTARQQHTHSTPCWALLGGVTQLPLHEANYNNNVIILLKQDYKVQLANNKIQMAWLTCWLVVG